MKKVKSFKTITLFVFLVITCTIWSCGNGSNSQMNEQAIRDSIVKAVKDSIANAEVLKAKQDSIEKVRNSIPPFADLFAFYKKANSKPTWSKVKKEVMAYMDNRGLKLVFDGSYKRIEYEDELATFSGLAYGKNIKYVKDSDDIKPINSPHFGIVYTTWMNDLETLDYMKFLFKDKDECYRYLDQVKACGFKDNGDYYENKESFLYFHIEEENGIYYAYLSGEH